MEKLLKKLKKLNLPQKEYIIYGPGPLGIRGIREIHDLDVVVKDSLYQRLLKKYPEIKDETKRFIKIKNIELIPASFSLIKDFEKVYERGDEIDGVKFVSLRDLTFWKKKMGRPKDFKDIQLIKSYLKNVTVKKYNKLIRDRILEIIEKDGEIPFWRALSEKEFLGAFKKKILEEAKELVKTKNKKEIINEIVDIQELIDTLTLEMGLSKKEIKKLQKIKNKKRGGFKKKIFLIKTEKQNAEKN